MASMYEREIREIETVHACGRAPVVLLGDRWLLPGNWASRAG